MSEPHGAQGNCGAGVYGGAVRPSMPGNGARHEAARKRVVSPVEDLLLRKRIK
jgi:hypothetical protein